MPSPEEDLVVLEDTRWSTKDSGRIYLARASEWCSMEKWIDAWNGPEMRLQHMNAEHLEEITCRTVLVDKDGFFTCAPIERKIFYPCPAITDELEEAAKKVAESVLEELANIHEAEAHSYITHEQIMEMIGTSFSSQIWAVSRFEDAVAVNGEHVSKLSRARQFKGWSELEERSGGVEGGESEIERDWLIGPISRELKISEILAGRLVQRLFFKEHILWTTGYGTVEVWLSKKAMRAYELAKDLERMTEAQKEERARKQREEFRRKVRRGGFPYPREWSPRGELPGE